MIGLTPAKKILPAEKELDPRGWARKIDFQKLNDFLATMNATKKEGGKLKKKCNLGTITT